LEDKIITLYAKGLSVRDIHDSLQEMYGVDVSASTISTLTEKVLPLVENWQNRRLEAMYPLIYLDGIYVNLKREGRLEHTAVYVVLAVYLEGRKDVLGPWVGDGAEGAKFWTNVLGQLQARGVQDILIACVDSKMPSTPSFLKPVSSAASCTKSATASNPSATPRRTISCAT
jgi:transposase-like protein